MMNENHEIESIWADGVPPRLNKEDVLTNDQLNEMAVDFTCKYLIRNGFKINLNFPRKEAPQIFCKKDGKVYGIFVLGSPYPNGIWINPNVREKIYADSVEHKFIPLFSNVLYGSKDKERLKAGLLLKGDVFNITFYALRKITEENQAPDLPRESSFWFKID